MQATPTQGRPLYDINEIRAVYEECGGNVTATAQRLSIKRDTVRAYRSKWESAEDVGAKPFEADPVPSPLPDVHDLIARRKADYQRKHESEQARKLVSVRVKIGGPIGIVHMGDPHVDDDGTDIGLIERHVSVINATEGLFGANLGDVQNQWVGRLAHLWGQQSTSAAEAWLLTEWLLRSVRWLYLVAGNHDCWAGEGDPLKWIMSNCQGVFDAHGARLSLEFPNGKQVRVNARHDFTGHSMWNPAHGPMKAIQGGWRDHILTCGHTHTSFIGGPLKDPSSGMLSWAIRCAGYKIHDRYAREKNLPDQNAFPAAVTVIDPRFADDDARLVTVIPDVEEGAAYLTFKRRHAEAGRVRA